MKNKRFIYAMSALLLAGMMAACNPKAKLNSVGKSSSKTGIKYSEDYYQPPKFKEQDPAPGLVLIPGGTFVMGGSEKDIESSMNNRQRQITVMSYYMDETEIANVDWKEFLADVERGGTTYRVEGDQDVPLSLEQLIPDTAVWARDLAFNDPLVQTYFSHPGFNMYPVVGVNWHQANEYCKWRTFIVNKQLTDDDAEAITYPAFRLPTEAEWEYAARGLQESEIYAWEGKSLRNRKGEFQANFKRGRGDYGGWQGGDGHHLTDAYFITAPVGAFWPNDFGLYNMSGNVAEWTQDAYRLLAFEDVDDFNSFRRKGQTEIRPDPWLDDVNYTQKNSLLANRPSRFKRDDEANEDTRKVYRGGSWYDIAYYLSPGVRRHFPSDSSSATIGFRCAMIRVGSPN